LEEDEDGGGGGEAAGGGAGGGHFWGHDGGIGGVDGIKWPFFQNLLANWAKELARKKIDQKPAEKAVKVNSGPRQILKPTRQKKGKQEEKRKKWLKKLQKFRKKISRKGRRRTRREMKPSAGGDKLPKNMRALKTLQAYLDRLEWAQRYLKGMSQESAR
jgi:hypothetical protein